MGKNKTKIIIATILVIGLSYTILESTKPTLTKFSSIAKLTNEYKIPDSLGARIHIRSLALVQDSLLYFSERKTARVYKMNLKTNTLVPITRIGRGPGEFQSPSKILLHNGYLYISGTSVPILNKYDFDGNFISGEKTETAFGVSDFFIYKSNVFKANMPIDSYAFTNLSTKQDFFKNPIGFKNAYPVWDTPGYFVISDTLYYMNAYQAKIFRYNLAQEKSIDHIEIKGFYTHDWDNEKRVLSRLEYDAKLSGYYIFPSFQKIIVNGKLYFFISTVFNYSNSTDDGKFASYIFSKNGVSQYSVDIDGGFIYTENNRVITNKYDPESGTYSLLDYRLIEESKEN